VPDSIAERMRSHAAALERGGRSPLSIALMRDAADDLDAGGIVACLFAGLPAPSGSVPGLRLLAALHWLALSGLAPELATYYPTAGGTLPPDGAWPAAERALQANFATVRERVPRTVQTNEVGRSAVLYGGLLRLSEQFGLPLRLLEIGASGGLNLLADRYAYRVGGRMLGDPASPLCFDEPWEGAPVADPSAAAARLRILEREGCDLAPLDLGSPADRLTLRSYLWPDEADRQARAGAALAVAEREPPVVRAQAAEAWLPGALARGAHGNATVVWQSVVWQYVEPQARAAIEAAIAAAPRPLAWLRMEPGDDPETGFVTTATTWPGGAVVDLARSRDHGPPVRWLP
jgi:hypothetical protein